MTIYEEIEYLTGRLPEIGKTEQRRVKKFLKNVLLAMQKKCCITVAYTNSTAYSRRISAEKAGKKVFYIKSFFYRIQDKTLILYTRIRATDTTISVKKVDYQTYSFATDNGKTVSDSTAALITRFLNYWFDAALMPRPQ